MRPQLRQLTALNEVESKSLLRAYGIPLPQEYLVGSSTEAIEAAGIPVRALFTRRDPFERADENSNTYWDWCISHAYLMYLMQGFVAGQIETFKKFPPRQKPASFNLDAVMRTLEEANSSANH